MITVFRDALMVANEEALQNETRGCAGVIVPGYISLEDQERVRRPKLGR
jgi:hypothetical protein